MIIPVPKASLFPIENLPLCIASTAQEPPRAWVGIGDHAVDLAWCQDAGRLDGLDLPDGCFGDDRLDRFLAAGPAIWSATRGRLGEICAGDVDATAVARRIELRHRLPSRGVDFVDFYSSLHHATNLGRLFRPDGDALLPNWRHLPVGYHGRTGTLVADGTAIVRPCGLRLVDGAPELGPTEALDFELEVGAVVGVGSELGVPIVADDAGDHLYGCCLVNDWSARDIQAFEYQPLGPFLGKSFATTVGGWVVAYEALAAHRVDPPPQVPEVASYLRTQSPWGLALELEVTIESAVMRHEGLEPAVVTRTRFDDLYWTPAQQLAHLTVNGASTAPGDLLGSGTVSGPTPGSQGSLIELTWGGARPIDLPDGTERRYLVDGDRVVLRGWTASAGLPRLGLGEVSGTIVSARSS